MAVNQLDFFFFLLFLGKRLEVPLFVDKFPSLSVGTFKASLAGHPSPVLQELRPKMQKLKQKIRRMQKIVFFIKIDLFAKVNRFLTFFSDKILKNPVIIGVSPLFIVKICISFFYNIPLTSSILIM